MKRTIKTRTVDLQKMRKKVSDAERATLPPRVDVPVEPIYSDTGPDRALYEEQQVSRVEILMIKGIRTRRTLMTLLEIKDVRQIDRYIARVHARWEMLGSSQDHARHRGEGLNRLDLIESELWSRMQNKGDDRAAAVVLMQLLQVQRQRSELLGLTPKIIERIGAATDDSIAFTRSVSQHERLSLVAARMLQLIAERTARPPERTIDHVEAIDAEDTDRR